MRVALVAALSLAVSLPARAEEAPPTLRIDPVVDGVVTGVVTLAFLATEVPLKHALAPTTCRWCVADGLDATVRSMFQGLDPAPSLTGNLAADTASNVTTFALVPALAIGTTALWTSFAGASWTDAALDVLLATETGFATLLLTQAVKFSVARARPFVSDLAPEQWPSTQKPDDNQLSFFSGHAAFATSIVVSAALGQTLRRFPHAWVTWAVGIPLALLCGGLRLAADKHWFTDVATGTLVGAAMGVAIPLLHGVRESSGVSVGAGPGGVVVSGRF